MAVVLVNFGNSAYNQSGSGTSQQQSASRSHLANDFYLSTDTVISSFSLWASDGVANNNGLFDSFSGTLSWRIYTAGSGVPGSLIASGTSTPSIVDTGVQDHYGSDLFRLDIAIAAGVSLAGGNTYWIAVHEGAWGSAFDGSELWILMHTDGFLTQSKYSVDGQGTWVNDPIPIDAALVINTGGTITATEAALNSTGVLLDTDVEVYTTEIFDGGRLVLSGLWSEETVSIRPAGSITLSGNAVLYNGVAIGTFSGGNGTNFTVVFNAASTAPGVEAVIEHLQYFTSSNTPPSTRTLSLSLSDSEGAATAFNSTIALTITPEDDPRVATADTGSGLETAVITGNVLTNDIDPDGGVVGTVRLINGASSAVGREITLPSGALLTLNANGSYSYNPNGAFMLVAPGSGANTSVVDTFSYTLSTGGTTTVSITVNGIDQPGDWRYGGDGADAYTGTSGNDIYYLAQPEDAGNTDDINGGDGDDIFFMGGSFGTGDRLNGGAGTDTVLLQGNYSTLLSGPILSNVETFQLMSGADNRFGMGGAGTSYFFIATDDFVAAGERLTIDGSRLGAGENFTFHGAGETDGSFALHGGGGNDTFTGGNLGDFFAPGSGADTVTGGNGIDQIYMGANLTQDDWMDGGASNDILGLQGNYANYTFSGPNLYGMETLAILSGSFTQYSGGTGSDRFDYHLTTIDQNVAAGQTFVVHATQLLADEDLYFDGSAETDGSFFFYSGAGNDTLIGGAGNDIFVPSTGTDTLTGGGGNDVFYYRFSTESPENAPDHITDFGAGDLINIMGLGQPSGNIVSFIGDAAFGNVGGQLRVTGSGTNWQVEIDVDGDGNADFAIDVTTATSGYAWSASDFIV